VLDADHADESAAPARDPFETTELTYRQAGAQG
jgi:hypothetical protein